MNVFETLHFSTGKGPEGPRKTKKDYNSSTPLRRQQKKDPRRTKCFYYPQLFGSFPSRVSYRAMIILMVGWQYNHFRKLLRPSSCQHRIPVCKQSAMKWRRHFVEKCRCMLYMRVFTALFRFPQNALNLDVMPH